jgi:hypothetical protein
MQKLALNGSGQFIQINNPWELAVDDGMGDMFIEFPQGYFETITKKELLSKNKRS